MSVAKVLKLDEYRDRRLQRLRRACAFYRSDDPRARILDHLAEAAEVTGSDRVGVAWVDEYAPALAHPWVLLDFMADRPRRALRVDPLHAAWEKGIPGTYEYPGGADGVMGGVVAVALGSDGARGWFLVAESTGARMRLDEAARERLLYLAGECSALALHRDLDTTAAPAGGRSFHGWRTLVDLEGFEGDSDRGSVVERRFMVSRLVRMFVDEDFVVDESRWGEQLGRARLELEIQKGDDEVDLLLETLDVLGTGDLARLSEALTALAASAERQDHVEGALDLYECAYEAALACGDPLGAIEAARYAGRILRRRARWQDADRWYEVALAIARAFELPALQARTLSGLGLVRRERGNFPAARVRFEEALQVAEAAGEVETLASVHHDLMGLEQQSGRLHDALRHGWQAVNLYRSDRGRTRCMAGLGGVLKELGDYAAAEDAYTFVARRSDEQYYLTYAYDGLTYLAALRGDESGFQRWAAACDRLGWEQGPPAAKAEILYFRGMAHALLGRPEIGRSWLSRAVAYADEHGFARVLFLAEEALREAKRPARVPHLEKASAAPPEVREGLRAMRAATAGV